MGHCLQSVCRTTVKQKGVKCLFCPTLHTNTTSHAAQHYNTYFSSYHISPRESIEWNDIFMGEAVVVVTWVSMVLSGVSCGTLWFDFPCSPSTLSLVRATSLQVHKHNHYTHCSAVMLYCHVVVLSRCCVVVLFFSCSCAVELQLFYVHPISEG